MISDLILVLMFVSIVCFIAGLIKPTIFSRFIKGGMTRKKAFLIFGGATIVCFIIFGIVTTPAKTTKQDNVKKIDYQIIQRWQIPNGGEGKTILIPKDYLNDSDMTALGSKLKKDVAGDRNAFIDVFTDQQAEALRAKVLSDKATQSETDLYDKNYVGSYTKNANTGYHEFVIFFDGVMGTNKKTIKY